MKQPTTPRHHGELSFAESLKAARAIRRGDPELADIPTDLLAHVLRKAHRIEAQRRATSKEDNT